MTRTTTAAALALLLAGCGGGVPEPEGNTPEAAADTAAPAEKSAGPVPSPTSMAAPAPSPSSPTPPVASAADDPDEETAEAARAVVQRYYALLARGDYAAARALWRRGSEGSGRDARAFARSFVRYASYGARVGAPGPVDAGAGQRYVTVPVTVRGTLKDGGVPFTEAGEVTLHRTGDIDGATAEQRSWRIEKIELSPGEAPAGDLPQRVTARYQCEDGTLLIATFDNRADTVTLRARGRTLGVLKGKRPASGIWYAGDGMTLRGKGRDASFEVEGQAPVHCVASDAR
ncbi:MliC family protein [Sphingomonas sp. MJ1 (PH-R8)]|uniref:MliC family protein n=1 Tax=Sphingomonas sp. MJ1 (PH-R8) TaxID=3112950 RepID=UPI003A8B2679